MTDTGPFRVLIVDDNRAIHEDYRKILCPSSGNSDLDALEAELFLVQDEEVLSRAGPQVVLESAFQGQQGLEKVQQAVVADTPFAMAFIDMRMPPGWDGLETTKRILDADPLIQVVICTAYSDHSWDELQCVLGATDRLLILKKPFDSIEVAQFVSCLTKRWALQRASASERVRLEAIVQERTRELELQLEFRETVEIALRERQRLESLGSLTAGLSHELNNPLCAISTNVDFLTNEIGHAGSALGAEAVADLSEVLDEIAQASSRIRDVVRDVRTFATQQGSATTEKVSIENMVGNAIRVATHRLRHIARVVVEPASPAFVMGDTAQLEQVLVNLLLNAGDAFDRNGGGNGARQVTVGWCVIDDLVKVWVRDNGKGIAKENLSRVMEPFFTTKGVGKGTGLGLSVCHGIITAMGGQISVESELGVGTSVCLELPSAECSAQNARIKTEVVADTSSKRVLIVDDDPGVRRAMKRVFRECTVDVVGSAAEGVEACADENYDVILCDLMMPDGLGTELYESLRARDSEQCDRLYLITGGAVTEAGISSLSAFPPERVLSKPVSPFDIWSLLHGESRSGS